MAFSPDAKFLASGSRDKKLRVYGREEGFAPRLLYTLGDTKNDISRAAFSPNSALLASIIAVLPTTVTPATETTARAALAAGSSHSALATTGAWRKTPRGA